VERLKRRLASELGVAFRVRLVEPKSLERAEGKVKRVEDRRGMGKEKREE
jgi:phenylacetate-CoA ligase